jgi:hypothetical protein
MEIIKDVDALGLDRSSLVNEPVAEICADTEEVILASELEVKIEKPSYRLPICMYKVVIYGIITCLDSQRFWFGQMCR